MTSFYISYFVIFFLQKQRKRTVKKKRKCYLEGVSSTQEKCRPFSLPQFLNQSGLPQRAAGVRIKTYHQQSNRGGTVGVRGNQLSQGTRKKKEEKKKKKKTRKKQRVREQEKRSRTRTGREGEDPENTKRARDKRKTRQDIVRSDRHHRLRLQPSAPNKSLLFFPALPF